VEDLQAGGIGEAPARARRRRTLCDAASSLGRIALLLGLPACLPRLVGRSPDRVRGFGQAPLDGEILAEEDAGPGDVTSPVRPLPSNLHEQPGTSLALRPEVRTAALAAAGGVLAGAATVAAVRVVGRAAAKVRPKRHLAGRRRERQNVVASRSFLVDVHLLGR
jgi:hypothetical protein